MSDASKRKCSVEGCQGFGRTKGLCATHYQRFKRHGNPLMGGPMRRGRKPPDCSIDGCDGLSVAHGLCPKHYGRLRKHGDTTTIGGKRAKWTEKIVDDNGYVLLPIKDHPNSRKSSHSGGRISEHRFVMSEFLGRPLFENENVHHKNGIKADNRIENLELWVVVQPKGQRPIDLIVYAREILSRYEQDEEKLSRMYREEIKPKLRLVAAQ